MSHIKQVVNNLCNKTYNAVAEYSQSAGYAANVGQLNDDLRAIDQMYSNLSLLLQQAKEQADAMRNADSDQYLGEPLKQNVENALNSLSEKITAYRESHDMSKEPEYVRKMCDPHLAVDLKQGSRLLRLGCTDPMIDLDDSPEAWQRRDRLISDIDAIRSDPKKSNNDPHYERLSDEEKKKYAQIVDYWWKNVKNSGFKANMDFMTKYSNMAIADHEQVSDGETAAFQDIAYTIFCPRKENGEIDYDVTKDLDQAAFLYCADLYAQSGRIAQNYLDEHPLEEPQENAPKEIKDQYKAQKKERKAEAGFVMDSSKEGFMAKEATGLNFLINNEVLAKHKDEQGNNISNTFRCSFESFKRHTAISDPEKFRLYTNRTTYEDQDYSPVKQGQVSANELNYALENKQAYQGLFRDTTHLDLNSVAYDRDYAIMDKCASLNKLNRALIDTKNGYIGHDNSDLFNNMADSMQKVEELTANKIARGEQLTAEERIEVNRALSDADRDIQAYLDSNMKKSYVHDTGETRRDIALAAESMLNPPYFSGKLRTLNTELRNAGKDRMYIDDFESKFGVGQIRVMEKNAVDRGVSRYNSGALHVSAAGYADPGAAPVPPARQVDNNLQRMIKNPQALDDYKRMFDVKHTARIIRWNSGLYNDTKKAMEDFQKYRDRVRDRMSGRLPQDDRKLEADMEKLTQSYEQCKELLPQYCEKVLGVNYAEQGDAARRKTAAGMMRAAGAGGALDEFMGNVQANTARQVKQISLKDLFNQEMRTHKLENNPDKHRQAASGAASRQKKLDKQAQAPQAGL